MTDIEVDIFGGSFEFEFRWLLIRKCKTVGCGNNWFIFGPKFGAKEDLPT